MQQEGCVQFLHQNTNSPLCCAFHPKDRYMFAWGGSDGEVALVSALRGELLRAVSLASLSLARAINSITFSSDGSKVVATSVSRKVSVVDVERCTPVLAYDNCVSPGHARQPLVMHPDLPYLAACTTVNARGITLLDLRMPLPFDFIHDLHEDTIHDLVFVDGSWPWGAGKVALVSASGSGQLKVNRVDGRPLCAVTGRPLCAFSTHPPVTCLAPTPESFNATQAQGYPSVLMASTAEGLVSWCVGERPWKWDSQMVSPGRVSRMRYTDSGGLLYAAQGGVINRYRRYPSSHQYVGEVVRHAGPVLDLDISPYNEYLISVGEDSKVGLLRLGSPNHGWTQYCEFT